MVVSFRVFKKASPNNKVTIYLGRRDFIDHVTESDPIDGVLLIDKEYLQGRQVNDKIRMAKYSALLILALVYEILNHASKNCLLYRSKRIKISSRDITDYI